MKIFLVALFMGVFKSSAISARFVALSTRLVSLGSALLFLCLFVAPAQAVQIYIQYDQSTIETDPAFVANSGTDFSASADLQAGEFDGLSRGAGNDDQNAYAGVTQPLTFTNNTGSNMTIAAGDFVAHVRGSYDFGDGRNQSSQVTGYLAVSIGGDSQRIAQGQQILAIGSLISGSPKNTINRLNETGGATINVSSATTSELIMDLVMPELVIAAGQQMTVYWELATLVNNGNDSPPDSNFVEADFLTGINGLQLALSLPEGAVLDSDASVPLDWIATVPVPAAAWLFGSALGLLGWMRRSTA